MMIMNTGPEHRAIIFLIEEDDEARPILKHNLQRLGYRVIVALDEADALERIDGEQLLADLILINLVGKTPEEVLSVGRRIRAHAKYDGHMPLIVLAEQYDAELEGTDKKVGEHDWIAYPEDAGQLPHLLAQLLPQISSFEF